MGKAERKRRRMRTWLMGRSDREWKDGDLHRRMGRTWSRTASERYSSDVSESDFGYLLQSFPNDFSSEDRHAT